MMTYLSKYKVFPIYKRPSLCGYCLRGGKGFYININDKIYAGCSYQHLEKIRERVNKKEDIKIKIEVNPDSVKSVLSQYKSTYQEYAKKNNSYVLHEWKPEDKEKFFAKFVALYLSLETDLANEGL